MPYMVYVMGRDADWDGGEGKLVRLYLHPQNEEGDKTRYRLLNAVQGAEAWLHKSEAQRVVAQLKTITGRSFSLHELVPNEEDRGAYHSPPV